MDNRMETYRLHDKKTYENTKKLLLDKLYGVL